MKKNAAESPKPLNVRQQRFCEFIVAGESQTDAYLKAGWKVPRLDAGQHASRLMKYDKIKAKIAALRAPQTKKALLTKDRQREILRDVAEDGARPAMSRLRAIEIDAKLAGYFAPDQMVVETGPKTLEAVKERAAAMASAMARKREEKDS
jgi:phage terminase small subunit